MKHVLVTGAGGSIGSVICEQLLGKVETLTLLSLTENGLFSVCRDLAEINSSTEIIPILGDIRNERAMLDLMEGVDTVVHAAAHKHVPICEANPIEAIENNVGGTLNLVEAAELAEVERFLLISTDKAVNPSSIMGMTKRCAELIVRSSYVQPGNLRFAVTRFGNVLHSAGSVMTIWREQLRRGEPITITDERCTRYFMTIPEAAGLVMTVLDMPDEMWEAAPIFVFDMGKPKRMIDLAENLMVASGIHTEIKTIGLRPGEKLHEELYLADAKPTGYERILRAEEPRAFNHWMLRDMLSACAVRKGDMAIDHLVRLTGSDQPLTC